MQTLTRKIKLSLPARLRGSGKFLLASLAIAISVFLIDYLSFAPLNPLHFLSANNASNGLWLRYWWYHGKYDSQPAEWEQMIERLRQHQIRYAYFHVLTTKEDGTLRYRNLAGARKITDTVHAKAPATRAIAWIYVGSALVDGGVDLSKPEVRANLVKESLWLVKDCGFDGVQIDYEFAQNGGQGLLDLLKAVQQALPAGRILSVATPMWYPGTLYGWDDAYFQRVAHYADQLAVMCYDSYLYSPRFYTDLVAAQVPHVSSAAYQAGNCKVVFGLPTYEDTTLAHHGPVESFDNGLRGVQKGLENPGTKRKVIDGIALFADYTTDGDEWSAYDRYWLGKH